MFFKLGLLGNGDRLGLVWIWYGCLFLDDNLYLTHTLWYS